jgi:hypothetical protein
MFVRSLRSLLVLIACSALFAGAQSPQASSQNSAPNPSSKRRLPTQHEVVAPFWTLEPGWDTQLEVSNNLTQEDLEVTPVLRTSDGSDLSLPPLRIPHDQARQVDLQTLVPDLNGRANSYGSVLFRYNSVSRGNLFATVLLQRLGHPMSFHFDAFPLDPDFVSGSRESILVVAARHCRWVPGSYKFLTQDSQSAAGIHRRHEERHCGPDARTPSNPPRERS